MGIDLEENKASLPKCVFHNGAWVCRRLKHVCDQGTHRREREPTGFRGRRTPGKFQGRRWVWPSRAFLNLALGHFGPENSLRGETVLCIVGCVVVNVASLYCPPPPFKTVSRHCQITELRALALT